MNDPFGTFEGAGDGSAIQTKEQLDEIDESQNRGLQLTLNAVFPGATSYTWVTELLEAAVKSNGGEIQSIDIGEARKQPSHPFVNLLG